MESHLILYEVWGWMSFILWIAMWVAVPLFCLPYVLRVWRRIKNAGDEDWEEN
jgi:hypothetical protein